MRVGAMLLVVLYHCLCMYTNRWNFTAVPKSVGAEITCEVLNYIHLPTFMMISGFLYGKGIIKGKYSNVNTFIKKKIIHLGIPYLFWGGIMLLLQPDFYKWQFFVRGFAHLWFLLCLLEIFAFVALCRKWILPKSNRNKILILALSYIISCSIFKVIPHISVLSYFCLDKFIYYFPIFYLGTIFSQTIDSPKDKILLSVFGLLASIVFLLLSSATSITYMEPLDFLMPNRLLGYIIVYFSFMLCYRISHNREVNKLLDRNSMGIYILHHIIIFYLLQYSWFLDFMESNITLGVISLFFGVLCVSLLISELILHTKLKVILG